MSTTDQDLPSENGAEEASTQLVSASERLKEMLRVTQEATDGLIAEAYHEAEEREAHANERLSAAREQADRELARAQERVARLPVEDVDRVVALADELQGHVERVNREAAQLADALAEARVELLAVLGTPAAQPENEEAEIEAEESDGEAQGVIPSNQTLSARVRRFLSTRNALSDDPDAADADYAAMQMVVAGEDAETIGERLREGYGVEDADTLLESLGVQSSRFPSR
jgi:hypothetical protein